MDFVSQSMDSLDPVFIEEIVLGRDREKQILVGHAVFGHIEQGHDADASSDEDLGKDSILEEEGTIDAFDSDVISDMQIPQCSADSALIGEFDGKDEHGFLVVRILIEHGESTLEFSFLIFEDEECPLAGKRFHFLLRLYGELHDIICQHLAIDDFGFYKFWIHPLSAMIKDSEGCMMSSQLGRKAFDIPLGGRH